jgi:hypothetical protein
VYPTPNPTNYPTAYPTSAPTRRVEHENLPCKYTYCNWDRHHTTIFTRTKDENNVPLRTHERWHCEKYLKGTGTAKCKCVCHSSFHCMLAHHHHTGYRKTFKHCVPTVAPTAYPTSNPTSYPTAYPTAYPTPNPTPSPTTYPTPYPTSYPTPNPTNYPTTYPTAYPTSAPTSRIEHENLPCKHTHCTWDGHHTTIFSKLRDSKNVPYRHHEHWHCEKYLKGTGSAKCKCVCHDSFHCMLAHHHHTGYRKVFKHCVPTIAPTAYPTSNPTAYPTAYPTSNPTAYPTAYPTNHPTPNPTNYPTPNPTVGGIKYTQRRYTSTVSIPGHATCHHNNAHDRIEYIEPTGKTSRTLTVKVGFIPQHSGRYTWAWGWELNCWQFTSGYVGKVYDHKGPPTRGSPFLTKAFTFTPLKPENKDTRTTGSAAASSTSGTASKASRTVSSAPLVALATPCGRTTTTTTPTCPSPWAETARL